MEAEAPAGVHRQQPATPWAPGLMWPCPSQPVRTSPSELYAGSCYLMPLTMPLVWDRITRTHVARTVPLQLGLLQISGEGDQSIPSAGPCKAYASGWVPGTMGCAAPGAEDVSGECPWDLTLAIALSFVARVSPCPGWEGRALRPTSGQAPTFPVWAVSDGV